MNGTSPEPHDHDRALLHPADVSRKGHEQHGAMGHAGHGESGAHDRHEGHLTAGILAARGILLPPALAAVLMSASTVIVAINAQLLRGARL